MSTESAVAPLPSISVEKHQIPAHGLIPNTSLQHKPLLIYRSCFASSSLNGGSSESEIQAHMRSVGVVEPAWVYPMYDFSHFHSSTHEVLGIASGAAVCCFGDSANPDRVETELKRGDTVVVPAGVAHQLVRVTMRPFSMVGSYPRGKAWDMCYGKTGEEQQIASIKELGWFERDPVYGDAGPVLDV